MRLVLSHSARGDLRNIARYTGQEWGAAQKTRYMRALHERLAELLRHPDLGVVREDLGPGYRSVPAGSHAVFYRRDADAILVLRVLHHRMDVKRHL